ncbi:WD repeat-containing protein 92 [Nowakowskiella sp. JEL0078]|nr:WD repeat-containing protein 92 [Nowakowskiella sp. JEL0078]
MSIETMTYNHGEIIINKGDLSDCMFFIVQGTVEVIGKDDLPHADMNSGQFFGEIGIIMDMKRTACIRAKDECHLLKLNKAVIDQVCKEYPEVQKKIKDTAHERYTLCSKKDSKIEQFDLEVTEQSLIKLDLFRSLENSMLKELAISMVRKSYNPKEKIVVCGDPSDSMFFLATGDANVISEFGEIVDVASGPFSWFGEVGILQDVPRTATVEAKSNCSVYKLAKIQVIELIKKYPDIGDIIKSTADARMQQYLMRSVLAINQKDIFTFYITMQLAQPLLETSLNGLSTGPHIEGNIGSRGEKREKNAVRTALNFAGQTAQCSKSNQNTKKIVRPQPGTRRGEPIKMTLDKPQIVVHLQKSLPFTAYDVKWIPSSAKFVVIGQHSRGSGALNVYELNNGSLNLVGEAEKENPFKCGTFGASTLHDRHFATGDFSGKLCLWDLSRLEVPIFSIDAHDQIINCIDGCGGMNAGPPEIATGSRDGVVKVWDVRQRDRPVAKISPAKDDNIRDTWTVAFGNSYNDDERVICAGYDNGDVKMFDLRNLKLIWETNVKNGDIRMNKLMISTLEANIFAFDLRTQHPKEGFASTSIKEKDKNETVWTVQHLPQNREIFISSGGTGGLSLYK